jgi:hypothetical protein
MQWALRVANCYSSDPTQQSQPADPRHPVVATTTPSRPQNAAVSVNFVPVYRGPLVLASSSVKILIPVYSIHLSLPAH